MTRESFVEQVFQVLSAGNGSTDSTVERLDINNYFPAALASAIQAEFFSRYSATAQMGDGGYIVDADFVTSQDFSVPDQCGSMVAAANILPLINSNGVRSVTLLPSLAQAIKVQSQGSRAGMSEIPVANYLLSPGGVDVSNIPLNTTGLRIEYVKDPSYYLDDEEIVAPLAAIDAALLAAERHFSPQVSILPDEKINLAKDQ